MMAAGFAAFTEKSFPVDLRENAGENGAEKPFLRINTDSVCT